MDAAEVSLPDTAIISTLMADRIPTTSEREIGITQPIREAPVAAAEVAAPVHVLVPVPVVAAPAAARKIHMKIPESIPFGREFLVPVDKRIAAFRRKLIKNHRRT